MNRPPWKLRLEFAIYCIEIVAARLGCTPTHAYQRMARVGLAQDFVRREDPLHTQSREYVTDEVIAAMLRREKQLEDDEHIAEQKDAAPRTEHIAEQKGGTPC